MLTRFPVFESIVSFSNITSSVSMNLNPFMSFNRFSKCDSTNVLVFVKWFNGFKLSWSSMSYDFAWPLRARFSSFILSTWSGLSVLGFGIGLYPSGGGNMRSSLTLLRGTGFGLTLSHFPVLGGLIRFVGSCATSSLNGSLSSKSSWLLTFFDFFCFNSNLINCPLVSFLRSYFSILFHTYIIWSCL